ncbi:MAG TPA: tetratricopeptide repeat protein [Candidatus Sulfotelmatobacter sp.]|jgi:Flp pilus assembly protein TadD|nr:tetratricopeptide repeat protein [Candidatus Sulfotelmatobacter sp.]
MRPCRQFLPILFLTLGACASPSGNNGSGGVSPTAQAVDASSRAAAEASEASGDYQTAAVNWKALQERHPEDADTALHLARSLRYSGQIQPATDLLNRLLDKKGRDPVLLTELGKCYLAGDRLGLAVRTLTEAATLAPRDWQVLSALGVAQDYQGRYAEAQQAYSKALELSPDNPVILNNLGLSQAQSGLLLQARSTLERAADQPKANAQVRQNLALVRALTGDMAGAERLNRQDLPPDAVRANGAFYKSLGGAAHME